MIRACSQVRVGEKIKGTCKFYIQEFFGKKIINANIEIVNTSDRAMHCQYYVAFFDEAGKLVGCAGQGTFDKGLAAGESTQLGGCLIPLPQGFHEKAVQYKIAFYESDKEIGKDAIVGLPNGNAGGRRSKAKTVLRPSIARARKWTDATGNFTVEAELVQSKDGTVRLKKGNGQIINLPVEKLSEADREYLRSEPNGAGFPLAGRRAKGADPDSASTRPGHVNAAPRQVKWYHAGPGWRELNKVAGARHIWLRALNHGKQEYETILSESQPGATVVLLFALDHEDKNVPAEYADLLPVPWTEVEATLKKGGTVEAEGESRKRHVVLLAAPTESQLGELIRGTKLLRAGKPSQ